MHSELESAFRRTNYRVLVPHGELILHVDRCELALLELFRETGTRSAALLTAHNPDGRRHAWFSNHQSQQWLRNRLVRHGYMVIAGRNEDPRGRWPAEPSLLVPGLPFAAARRIAMRYGQVAFLWLGADATPRLMETAARPGHQS